MSQLVLAIPTFRAQRFLPATLESLAGEGERVRWYLQDALSDDRTLEIARQYQRPQDKVVSERDAGQADALNKAFRAMGGEIVGFINGDDCLLPGTAERVLREFDEHPEIDIVCGGVVWIDAEGKELGKHHGSIETLREVLDIYHVWWRERQWVQPEVFYRRSLFERAGGFDPSYRLAFDFDFWVRCFRAGARVQHLAEPLVQFRLHANQKSAASAEAADEIRAITRRHLLELPGLVTPWGLPPRLSYDLYTNGRGADAPQNPLWTELLRHPQWLAVPDVWRRFAISISTRLFGSSSLSQS